MLRAEDADSLLSTGPSFTYGGRYNQAGEFGALYLSEAPAICEKEKLRQAGDQPELLPPRVAGAIEVDIVEVLDLTDEDNVKALGFSGRDLVDLLNMTLPRDIPETARRLGIQAQVVPSAVALGKNLVIFEESLSDPQCKVRLIRTEKWRAQRSSSPTPTARRGLFPDPDPIETRVCIHLRVIGRTG